MGAYGSCAPAGRTWTGTKPSPTPSPRPPRLSTTWDPRGNHERAAAGHGRAATALITGTCGGARYAVVGADRAAGQPSRPSLPSPVTEDARYMLSRGSGVRVLAAHPLTVLPSPCDPADAFRTVVG